MRNALLRIAVSVGLLAGSAGTFVPASAQSIVATEQSLVSARLLPGKRESDGSRLAGLSLSLAPGWKTYWRTPGEAGIPPRFDWSASENVASLEMFWPRPEMFESFGLRAAGYSGDVVLPIRVTPTDPDRSMALALTADLGVCRDICVLEQVRAREEIPADLRAIGFTQISRALAHVPASGAKTGLAFSDCRITGQGAQRRLEAAMPYGFSARPPEVLIEGGGWLRAGASETWFDGDMLRVAADLHLPDSAAWIDRASLRFTVLGADIAAEIRGCTVAPG